MEHALALFGSFDGNIKIVEDAFSVTIVARGTEVKISGDPENVYLASKTVEGLLTLIDKGEAITDQRVHYVIGLVREGTSDQLSSLASDVVCITAKGKPLKAKTLGQKKYVDAMKNNTITFGIGPAGTGKTYLAVAMAVRAFRAKEVNRIILTRPAVEAGEKLGFLPGDLQEKIDPYLRPLYDALADMFGYDQFQKMIDRNIIEVAPLAYMRGRTLEESFIILDEAQNTTREQMKMFLTRMGNHSRVVVNGDATQIDLVDRRMSGLTEAEKILKDVRGVGMVYFSDEDVVRHDMVGRIIRAYETYYHHDH